MECNCDNDAWYNEDRETCKETVHDEMVSVTIADTIDFGKVSVGKKACKYLKIKNTTDSPQEYFVQYDPQTNPIYRTFDFNWSRDVDPGETFECKVIYKPLFPFTVSVDYLFVQEKNQNLTTILLRGESTGPSIELSVNQLNFFAHRRKRIVERIVGISNTGETNAVYKFDAINLKMGLYSLSKSRGTIPPHKSDFVKITFNAPKEVGMYSEKLCVLILHHRPRIIHLLGFNTVEEIVETDVLIKHYNFEVSDRRGYGGYFYDMLTSMVRPPPTSFSDIYLNFEGVHSENNGSERSKTLVTSLTNHMSDEVVVEWYHADTGVFTIMPKSIKIPANDSQLFECKFSPPDADQFYEDILSAGVYWVDPRRGEEIDLYATVPIPIRLRLLGHSFPFGKRWIPQLSIPDTVILPPCLTDSATHTTFLLKLKGYLPVSYKFLPPKNAQFILKPMMGVIDDYQIVAVHFRSTGGEHGKAFVERWGVELNGTANDFRFIYVKTYCERPTVTIGNDNTVTFPTVHPNCQEIETVQIQNTSVHAIKYKFQISKQHAALKIDYPEGRLASNEVINLEWTVTGNLIPDARFTVICEIRALEEAAIDGSPFEIPVQVYVNCAYSILCSMPTKCNFRKVEVGAEHTFRFNLFNFGESTIHYNLIFWDRKRSDFSEQCMNIIPRRGSIRPKGRQETLLVLHCASSGTYKVTVYYQTRLNKDSAQIIEGDQIRKVFSFKVCVAYPLIQIVAINDHNFGPLFSKSALWELFAIDKINNYLKSMKSNETRNVNILMPESEYSNGTFETVWELQNVTSFDTYVSLKRKKLCDCPQVQTSKKVTFRQLVFDCKHRNIFTMSLSESVLQANAYSTLTLLIRYQEVGITHLCYEWGFSHNRRLKCNIFVNTLTEAIDWPSKYLSDFHLKMGSVSVDNNQPPVRAFWLYNNSSNVVSYKLDVRSRERTLRVNNFEILHCFNPEGSLLPFSTVPLLFNFRPLQQRGYNLTLAIQLGDHFYPFRVSGTGIAQYSDRKLHLTLPSKSSMNPMDDIAISEEHIAVRPFFVWTKTETVIFIRNLSKVLLVGYCFESVSVEGIVDVKVLHGKGVLKPKETHMLVVQINAFDQPCSIRLQLPCKLLDHTAYYKHKQTAMTHELRQTKIKDYFIITEHETQHPTNDVVIAPMPLNFYKTISLDIDIMTPDRADDEMNDDRQLFQFPQYLLNLDYSRITAVLTPKERDQPINSSESLGNRTEEAGTPSERGEVVTTAKQKEYQNIELLRDTIDCIILNVLESDLFWRVIREQNDTAPPYYIQFKDDDTLKYGDVKGRQHLVCRSLKTIQPPMLSDIFGQIIMDSIHEVFLLGSQVKSTLDLQYVYDMDSFKCKSCSHKTCTKQIS
ncbi:putative coiled-coil domain-containing protein 108 [Trypoxylus dichotomus]